MTKKRKVTVQPGLKKFTREERNLMRAIQLREKAKGSPVTAPGEVFAILQAIGYQREDDTLSVQERAREFVGCVRETLLATDRRTPTYRQVLQAMRRLGYSRPVALAS